MVISLFLGNVRSIFFRLFTLIPSKTSWSHPILEDSKLGDQVLTFFLDEFFFELSDIRKMNEK